MSHPILDRIREVKQKARRLAVSRSLCIVLSITVAVALCLAMIDFSLRIEDTGTRFLFLIGWLAAIGFAVHRWLLPVLRTTWSDQSIAQMIERHFPTLAGKLSSAHAFLTQTGESYGSKPLMRNVIASTTDDASRLNFLDAINTRPTQQAVALAVVAIVLGGVPFFIAPQATSQAAVRLLTPWKPNPWPRVHHLKFVDPPTRVGRGGKLRLAVVDESGRLPPKVEIQIRYEGTGNGDIESIAMRREVSDSADEMVFERNNLGRSFFYRAIGGDDQTMDWTELQVVEPPRIVSGQMEITPPAYTGWQPRTIDEPSASLRLLEGTSLAFRGTADRRLQGGALHVQSNDDEQQDFAAQISDDGVGFETELWTVTAAAEYTMHLVDQEGTATVHADRWNVRVLKDDAPTLALIEPDVEELVTPGAVLRIVCDTEDDLAIRRVDLHFSRTDQSEEGDSSVSLFAGPPSVAVAPMPETLPAAAHRWTVTHDWSLAPMKLPPGAVLSFYVVAEDYKLQRGQTVARRLVVVSDTELIDRAGRRQSLVLSRLRQRLTQQRRARQGVESVRDLLAETLEIDKPAIDRLKSALLAQRQVNAALQGEEAEVLRELRRLKRLLDRSQIGDVDVRQRVENTLGTLEALGAEHLDPAIRHASAADQSIQAERDLERANKKGGDAAITVPEDVPGELERAASHQAESVKRLEELLDEMSAWDNYRRFAQELGELLRQQQDIRDATEAVARETLSRRQEQLDGKQRASLRSTAARQLELARRTERTLANLEAAREKLEASDPQASQMVGDAMQAARDNAVSGRMREAGRQIDQNRPGLAREDQAEAEQALKSMLDELSRRSYSQKERVEKLEETGRELERLRKRQAELTKEFERAAAERDEQKKRRELQRLKKRQAELAQKMKKLQRQLQRLRANDASRNAGQASQAMEGAAQDAQQGNAQQAQQQSQLAEEQMEQAQQKLQEAGEQAKTELAREQMIRLPQMVDGLIGRQVALVEELRRLDEIRQRRGELTAAQEISVEIAAETQRTLATDTQGVAEEMSALPAFVFALGEVQELMYELADRLDRLTTTVATIELGDRVLAELRLVREMMERESDSQPQQPGDGGGQGGEGGEAGQQPDFDAQIAQLKLLRGMQIRINEETIRLNDVEPADTVARRDLDRQLQGLADRQGELAGVVGDLVAPPSAAKSDLPKANEQQRIDVEGPPEDDGLDALDRELDLLLQ